MNLLDKAIRAISPERALKRFEARRKLEILNSGYSRHGGSYAKKSLMGWLKVRILQAEYLRFPE